MEKSNCCQHPAPETQNRGTSVPEGMRQAGIEPASQAISVSFVAQSVEGVKILRS